MAAQHVSGAAALLVQWFGASTTPDAIQAKLMQSATKAFPPVNTMGSQLIRNDRFPIGAGYLDGMAAASNANAAPAGRFALFPVATYTCGAAGGSNCVRIAPGDNFLFRAGSASLWGDGKGGFPLSVLGQDDR